ncbi:MAG: HDOD domain-containing protein [Phycisphaeraceae bacterium]|nr:HDOD domain-containing protein [Phycisphaeraceae bacterium]
MKPRSQLSAVEVEALMTTLVQRLEECSVATQPEVAAKILQLVQQCDAGMSDFSKVVRSDAALSGRMLRLANSAYFAQRSPVTNVDRACVLLGVERLRALCLSYYISQDAADPAHELSRRIWGQSLFRACLAGQIAQRTGGACVAEAFVIGLLIDVGVPLMARLGGQRYLDMLEIAETPTQRHKRELDTLAFTHVDIAAVLIDRWKLPELLAKPIIWHHTRPASAEPRDDLQRLHRIAYCVGMLDLDHAPGGVCAPAAAHAVARSVLHIEQAQFAEAVSVASNEYHSVCATFADVADAVSDLAALAQRAHERMNAEFESFILTDPDPQGIATFDFVAGVVEVETDSDSSAIAYLRDSSGRRLVSFRFNPGEHSPQSILAQLGVEPQGDDDIHRLAAHLRRLAA